MLLQFSVKNFRTFKDKASLSLLASNYDKETRESENIYHDPKFNLRILKSAVVYGANASGKSKLFEALMFMKKFVITSSKDSQTGDPIDVIPFRLNTESEQLPTEMEVIFTYKDVMYRYGFEADNENIISEWLFYKNNTKEIELFYRDEEDYNFHRQFNRGKILVKSDLVRNNALLVSVAAQFKDPLAIEIINWFKNLKTISGLNESGYKGFTWSKTEDPVHKVKIIELLKAADLGIQDIRLEGLDIDKLPEEIPDEIRDRIIREVNEENKKIVSDVSTTHKKYDTNKKFVTNDFFSMDDDESAGTRKFFALTGPILDVLENGYTIIVDELDSKLHPNLVCKIVSLFNNSEVNKKNAQLIFNTHDTNLLSSGLFRRDQIWFTDKNKFGEAKLYSLADFKSDEVRKFEQFEENYIRGKYGAIPYLGFFDNLNFIPEYENEG